jgi:hypothetical protein
MRKRVVVPAVLAVGFLAFTGTSKKNLGKRKTSLLAGAEIAPRKRSSGLSDPCGPGCPR